MEQINSWLEVLTDIKENRLADIIIAIVIVILSIMISSLISILLIKVFKLKEDKENLKKYPLFKSIKRIFLFSSLYLVILVLKLPEDWYNFFDTVIRILIIWNVAGTIANLIAPDSKLIKKIKASDKIDEDDTIVKALSRFGKVRSICNCNIYRNIRIKL